MPTRMPDLEVWPTDRTVCLPSTQRVCRKSRPKRNQQASGGSLLPKAVAEMSESKVVFIACEIERLTRQYADLEAEGRRTPECKSSVAIIPGQEAPHPRLRYETHVSCAIDRTLNRLDRLQRMRKRLLLLRQDGAQVPSWLHQGGSNLDFRFGFHQTSRWMSILIDIHAGLDAARMPWSRRPHGRETKSVASGLEIPDVGRTGKLRRFLAAPGPRNSLGIGLAFRGHQVHVFNVS